MSNHIKWDYPPPRSWEQFEELCADVFQSAWRDPALVRHGRAGQRQFGVDIVARSGAIYPIGLQCKRRAKWPVKKLTTAEIDAEVNEARKFTPALKAFYLLTTAPDDTKLQGHVRKLNEQQDKAGSFEVVLLGWSEIVRRATLDRAVASKHFGPVGVDEPGSPLLATWMVSKGKLEKIGEELSLSVKELAQDLRDWPSGHFVIRQRESEAILNKLRSYERDGLSIKQRRERADLREKLATLEAREQYAEWAAKIILTDPIVSISMLKVWDRHDEAPIAIEGVVYEAMGPKDYSPSTYLRICAPKDYKQEVRCAVRLSEGEASDFTKVAKSNEYHPAGPFTLLVSSLPPSLRAGKAIPALLSFLHSQMSAEQHNDQLTWEQIRERGYLSLGDWWTILD